MQSIIKSPSPVAPIPQRSQLAAQSGAGPVRMRRQKLANLLQFNRADMTPLHNARFTNRAEVDREKLASPEESATILPPPKTLDSSAKTYSPPLEKTVHIFHDCAQPEASE